MSLTASDQSTTPGDHKVVKQCYLFLCCHDEKKWALILKGASEKSLNLHFDRHTPSNERFIKAIEQSLAVR
jgi:hypothetical protein